MSKSTIARAASQQKDLRCAAAEIKAKLTPGDFDFCLVFYGPRFPANEVASEFSKALGNNIFGCSTAGEISETGYGDDTISVMGFPTSHFKHHGVLIQHIGSASTEIRAAAHELSGVIEKNESNFGNNSKSFVIDLIDGLSFSEEVFMGQIGNYLNRYPIIGGSAGDGLEFKQTTVLMGDKVFNQSALLLGVTTNLKFKPLKTQHFLASDHKMVITRSDPKTRTVFEIDGYPAAEAYAKALNLTVEQLGPKIFSTHAILLKIAGDVYVRSIQKVNPDLSLTFYCAIEDGLVLSLARHQNLYASTVSAFKEISTGFQEIDATLAFECILRKLEVNSMPESDRSDIQSLYRKYHVSGFHTYGEQKSSVHINQTLTGVVFGK